MRQFTPDASRQATADFQTGRKLRKLVAGAVATGEAAGEGAAFERGLELRSYPENYGQRQAARRRGGQAGLFRIPMVLSDKDLKRTRPPIEAAAASESRLGFERRLPHRLYPCAAFCAHGIRGYAGMGVKGES